MKKTQKYHPNSFLNDLMVAALSGDGKVRADLTGTIPDNLRARNDELRAKSDMRNSDRSIKAKEEALAILRKREEGKQ